MGFLFYDLNLDRDRNSIPDVWERNRKSSKLISDILNNYDYHQENLSVFTRYEFA